MCPGTNQSWKLITDFSWRATRSSLGNSEGIVERRVRRFPWRRKEGCYNNAGRSQTLLKSMYLKTIPWHPHLHTPSLEVATACGWAAFSLAGFFALGPMEEIGSVTHQWAVSLPVSSDWEHSYTDERAAAHLCLVYLRPLQSIQHARREGTRQSCLVHPSWRQPLAMERIKLTSSKATVWISGQFPKWLFLPEAFVNPFRLLSTSRKKFFPKPHILQLVPCQGFWVFFV